MPKKYEENKELKRYFKSHIKKLQVDRAFKPIIVDILMRRAYQYDLEPEEIEQDIISLMHNLKKISVREMPKGYERAAGLYIPDESKEIIIRPDICLKNSPEELYQTLTHEVYHALSHDEHGHDRLGGKNSITQQYNSSLLEAIVEKASYRTVYESRYTESPFFNRNARGYSDITFITDTIEAVYGITEQALLRNAIMGRERLCDFLSERHGETPEETKKFLDALEANYALLHKTLYPFKEEKVDTKTQIANLKDSLSGIYSICYRKLRERLCNRDIIDKKGAELVEEKAKFSFIKLNAIRTYSLEQFSARYGTQDIKSEVYDRTESDRVSTAAIISNMGQVLLNFDNFPSIQEGLRIFNWARHGKLANYGREQLEELGISLDVNDKFEIPEIVIKKNTENERFTDEWESMAMPQKLKSILSSRAKRKDFFKNFATSIKKIFKKQDLTLLNTAENNTKTTEEQNIPFGALTKEQLNEFNKKAENVIRNSLEKRGDTINQKDLNNKDNINPRRNLNSQDNEHDL